LAGIRIALGWVFLWAFLDKTFGLGFATTSAKSWLNGGNPTNGFLGSAKGPFSGFYHSIAGTGLANVLFMAGLFAIGVALILGIGMRVAAAAGALLTIMMWTAVLPPTSNPFMDDHAQHAGAGRTSLKTRTPGQSHDARQFWAAGGPLLISIGSIPVGEFAPVLEPTGKGPPFGGSELGRLAGIGAESTAHVDCERPPRAFWRRVRPAPAGSVATAHLGLAGPSVADPVAVVEEAWDVYRNACPPPPSVRRGRRCRAAPVAHRCDACLRQPHAKSGQRRHRRLTQHRNGLRRRLGSRLCGGRPRVRRQR